MSIARLHGPPSVDGSASTRERVLRAGRVSLRWRRRTALVALLMVLGLIASATLSLAQGPYAVSPDQVLAAVLGSSSDVVHYTVMELRMPRTLTGIVAGFALGMSGALTQTVTRNPIASPDVLGVTAGASLGAVAVIALGGPASASPLGVPVAALLGGLLTAAAVFALSWHQGADSLRLIITGIAVNAVLVALVSWMLVVAELSRAVAANVWLVGSLDGTTWTTVAPSLVLTSVLGLVALGASRLLPALALGEDTAAALGVHPGRARTTLLLLSVALAAVGVAAAGPIGFIAFAAPQLALRIVRTPSPPVFCSGALGALLITASDLLLRVASPVPLPVGIMTTLIGGPFLIYLIIRITRRRSA